MDFFWNYSLLFVMFNLEILPLGTNATWKQRFMGSGDNCEASDKLQSSKGEYNFTSHFGRHRDFCLFLTPNSREPISITFVDFEISYPADTWNCGNFVEISSLKGTAELASSRQRYCGTRYPETYFALYGSAVIWVHREYSLPNNQLLIRYSTAPKCGGNSVITSYKFITSPGFPSFSSSRTRCNWTVSLDRTRQNSELQFQITSWTAGLETRVTLYRADKKSVIASFDDVSMNTSPEYARSKVFDSESSEIYIDFYSGAQALASFNATIKVKGYCIPGTYPCGDGLNCYTQSQLCDSRQDCSTGYDELGCAGCAPTLFWCGGDSNKCYSAMQRCNAFKDCVGSTADEDNCKTCGPGSFLCKTENKCIYESWRCDSDNDCSDRSDEEDCSYRASRRVITAAVIGSLVLSLLLVIALGCTCKLYSLRASHHRHPHHQYRATPLTRVERELFQRQAPPTYDMMISGAPTEAAANPRIQRQRRRRNRYQFQRAAPANIEGQSNRAEGADSGNTRAATLTQTNTSGQNPSTPNPYVVESVPGFLAEMMFGAPRGSSILTSNPVLFTKDSGTQTSMNSNNDSRGSENPENPSSSSLPRQSSSTSSTSSSGRSTRNSQGNRSRSRRSTRSSTISPTATTPNTTNPQDQQAKPLPRKKRISPVMVQAPLADSAVEEDTLACVYPCPPSYSQAVASDDPKINTDMMESTTQDGVSLSSGTAENENQSQDVVFDNENELLTTTKSKFFSFSIARAFRNMAASSLSKFQRTLSKFQRNSYTQMTTQSSENDVSTQEYPTANSTNNRSQSSMSHRQLRPSTSSDESMLDCTMENVSLGPNNELLDMTTRNNITQATTSEYITEPRTSVPVNINAEVFLQRNVRNDFNLNKDNNDNDSLHMEDF